MKFRLQVVVFLGLIILVTLFAQNFWGGWLWGAIYIIFAAMAFLVGVLIFFENRHPSKTITWLIVLAVNPIVGFVLYLLMGQSFRKKRMFAEKAIQDEQSFKETAERLQTKDGLIEALDSHQENTVNLAKNLAKSPISFSTYTQVLTNGEETFKHILAAMRAAKHHIHLQYYIVRDDELGREIQQILIEKAENGVEVRFLYDAVGCLKLSDSYIQELRDAGAHMQPFSPVAFPFLSNRINFRNHRKSVIVDGEIGFLGGLNIGDEYLGKDPFYGFWRDTHLKLEGEAVRTLQLYFLRDWFYMTDEKLLDDKYLCAQASQSNQLGAVQIIGGGPDDQWEIIKKLFFSMINSAKKTIWISSPYFIPDEDVLSALKVAALSGIEVRLLVPSSPDKKVVFYASHSYYLELLEAGVHIHSYEKGFMHSKIIIVDQELASIGTSNMDMRSFHLNFEINCFLYRTSSVRQLTDDFKQDLLDSTQLELHTFKNRKLHIRLKESLSRLASPLL